MDLTAHQVVFPRQGCDLSPADSSADEGISPHDVTEMSGSIHSILLIDGDPSVGRFIDSVLPSEQYRLIVRRNLLEAQAEWRRPWSAILVASVLPDGLGTRLLRDPGTQAPILILAAHDVARVTIEAMKAGAFDCLRKPLDPQLLRDRLATACRTRGAASATMANRDPAPGEAAAAPTFLAGRNPAILEVYKSIGRVSRNTDVVLVQGEIGVGKESVARAIQEHSGHEGGLRMLYGPALEDGRLNLALDEAVASLGDAGGGVLLQEVSEIGGANQAALLARLREQNFNPASAGRVRYLATSTTDLADRVKQGDFRADLYYLLSAQTINIPPLRERKDDLPELVFLLLSQLSADGQASITEDALDLLSEHDWPGNVDELTAVLKRCLTLGAGSIVADQTLHGAMQSSLRPLAPPRAVNGSTITDWRQLLESHLAAGSSDLYAAATAELDRQLLGLLLQRTGGNQSEAARILGITRASLRKRLRAAGIQAKRISVARSS